LEALRPAGWWEPAFVTPSPAYAQALATAARLGIPWERVGPGRQLQLDGVTLTVLAPDSAWTAQQHDANETSVVVRVDFGMRRLLFTGDAEASEEGWLVDRVGCAALRADVLKLGHHGSRTSTTPAFLRAVAPRLAIASVGAGNRYGHPAPAVTARLAEAAIPLWRTDEDGTVVVRTNGRTLTVEGLGGRWVVPGARGEGMERLPCPA
jgi:competence protein ComEC